MPRFVFPTLVCAAAVAACATPTPPTAPDAPPPETQRLPASPPPDDYLARFRAMVAELDAHPRVRVTHFWVGDAATDAEIGRVQEALGYALSPAILDVYRQANGLQLRWVDVDNARYRPGRDDVTITTRTPYLQGDNDDANGLVNLLPLGEAFVDADYEGQLYWDWMTGSTEEFAGKTYPLLDFSKALRPVDPFSFYNSMGYFVAERTANPPLIMGDDHDACWTDSRLTDFRSYLEAVLHHRGDVQARRDLYGDMFGHRSAVVTFAARAPRPIDALLPPRR